MDGFKYLLERHEIPDMGPKFVQLKNSGKSIMKSFDIIVIFSGKVKKNYEKIETLLRARNTEELKNWKRNCFFNNLKEPTSVFEVCSKSTLY